MPRCIFIVLLSTLLFSACHRTDGRLSRISDNLAADADPLAAIDSLNSICRDSLDEHNRHFYDFLTVKTADKAYITHTSDSLINSVIEWAQKSNRSLLPEALYYGGRVHSDMGDLPTAVRYFEDAAEILPADADSALRINIISQTGRLLSNLHLNDAAMPYLKESLRLSTERNDPMLAFDYELLSANYVDKKQYGLAEEYLTKAVEFSKNMSDEDQAIMQGKMAVLKYELGQYDSALALMRGVPQRISPRHRDYFSVCAADIFYKTGNYDSAYAYSKEILNSRNISYRVCGYKYLLTPELKLYSHPDTLDYYLSEYQKELSIRYNEHDAQSVIIQNSLYNYSLHERRSNRLQKEKERLRQWLIYLLIFVMMVLLAAMIFRQRNIRKIVSLQNTLASLQQLEDEHKLNDANQKPGIEELRATIERKLKDAPANNAEPLSEILVHSEGFQYIKTQLAKGNSIAPASRKWEIIEAGLNEAYPNFLNNLEGMSGGKLREDDKRVAMLIKMQFSNSEMAKLLAKGKSTISYHRRNIFQLLLPHLDDVNLLSNIIQLL